MQLATKGILARNNVQVRGQGPPVVFVHGFGCDQTMWARMAPVFERDHQLILYDLTGMGGSDYHHYDRERHGSLEGHAEDLIEILEALDAGPVAAVGHSVSAIIVGLAAIRRPALFSSLVMIGPNPRYVDDPPYRGGFSQEDIHDFLEVMDENHLGWTARLSDLVAGPAHEQAAAEMHRAFCRSDPEILRHFARVTFLADNRDDLPRIRVPTLIVHCATDTIAPPAVAQYVHQQVPDSRLVTMDCTGHAPHMTVPEKVTATVRGFLAEP